MKLIPRMLAPLALGCAIFSSITLASAQEDGFKPIFNGKDLAGWDGDPELWSVRDGAITGQTKPEKPLKNNSFLIWRAGELDDFELRLSYRIQGDNDENWSNSGIQYRSKDLGDWSVAGYQADIDGDKTYAGILYEERGRGIIGPRGDKTVVGADGKPKAVGKTGDPAAIKDAIKLGEWNDYVVLAQGNHLIQKINGQVTVDITDEDAARRARSGILALQIHVGKPMTVQFKNVRLKRLKLAEGKKVVLVAGSISHGSGDHEHNAAVQLWKQCFDQSPWIVAAAYAKCDGWPKDPTAFDNADAIVLYADGGARHPFIQENRLEVINALAKKGVGIGCVHYAVEVPKDKGSKEMLEWTGGYFETDWSVNPFWTADFKTLPAHPVTRGVKPFQMKDEWYYHMRFREGMKGVTPILTDLPPAKTLEREDGPHSNNPHVRAAVAKGEPQHVMWVSERPDGGRGFGFTGGHYHSEWGHEDFRKVVLNAICWIARAEVPANGIESKVTPEQLAANLDPKKR